MCALSVGRTATGFWRYAKVGAAVCASRCSLLLEAGRQSADVGARAEDGRSGL